MITHRLDGEGPPLLLLNGGLMTIASWEPLSAPLSRSFRVVRCDFRGQLLSPGIPEPELDAHVTDVAELLAAVGIDSIHVAGTSYGGLVGMRLAATRPELVASLTVITSGPFATEQFTADARLLEAAAIEAIAGGEKRRVLDLIHASAFSAAFLEAHPGFTEALALRANMLPDSFFEPLAALLRPLETFDLRDDLPRISAPTLVVEASEDRVFPPPASETIEKLVPGARRITIEGGHALVVEQPEKVAEAIRELVESAAGD